MSRPGRATLIDLAVSTALALAVFGPLLVGPWLLAVRRHGVRARAAVEGRPGSASTGRCPARCPMDALVSVVTQVVPGSWVQRAFLVGGSCSAASASGGSSASTPGTPAAGRDHPAAVEPLGLRTAADRPVGDPARLPGAAVGRPRRAPAPCRAAPGWAEAAIAVTVARRLQPVERGDGAVAVLAVLGTTRDRRAWLATAAVGVLGNLTWLVPALTADAVAGVGRRRVRRVRRAGRVGRRAAGEPGLARRHLEDVDRARGPHQHRARRAARALLTVAALAGLRACAARPRGSGAGWPALGVGGAGRRGRCPPSRAAPRRSRTWRASPSGSRSCATPTGSSPRSVSSWRSALPGPRPRSASGSGRAGRRCGRSSG